ncbi:MAG: hypothetical protein QW251_05455 [Desulfurococcaceae archaeon]
MKVLQKDRIEKVGQDLFVRLYPQELKDLFLVNGKQVVFVVEEVENIELGEDVIESDFCLLFKVRGEKKVGDTLQVELQQVPVFYEDYHFGCFIIKNVKAKHEKEVFHLGYIKKRVDNPKHDFEILGNKAICKNCKLEIPIAHKHIKELDEHRHEVIAYLENGQEIRMKEYHNEECFGKCFAKETQELVSILEKVKIKANRLIHPEFEVDLNPKKSSSLEFNTLEDYHYIEETVRYRPIFIKGNEKLYSRMKELLYKLRNILQYSEYRKFVKIFAGL